MCVTLNKLGYQQVCVKWKVLKLHDSSCCVSRFFLMWYSLQLHERVVVIVRCAFFCLQVQSWVHGESGTFISAAVRYTCQWWLWLDMDTVPYFTNISIILTNKLIERKYVTNFLQFTNNFIFTQGNILWT